MSRAFVKEEDDQWLSDISPTMNALMNYLTRENNGIRVYERQQSTDENGRKIHLMSNGLTYRINEEGKWQLCTS